MTKKQFNFLGGPGTTAQLKYLTERFAGQGSAIRIAIDRAYREETGGMLKIAQNIDTGLWFENSNGIIASAWDDIGGEGGRYILNFHKGHMPAYASSRYDTLTELETAMREFEPDLRKWCVRMD